MTFPALDPGYAVAFALVLARFSGLFLFAPIFSSRSLPVRVKIMILAVLSLATVPSAVRADLPLDGVALALLAGKELLVGFALALAVGALLTAVQVAGALIDTSVGFSLATLLDPLSNIQTTVLGQLYVILGSLVFLLLDGHHLLLAGLASTFELFPLTAYPDPSTLAENAVDAVAGLFSAAVRIAAPVLVSLFVTDLAVGLVSRAVPQANLFAVGFPVKAIVGLAAVGATLPLFVTSLGGQLAVALDGMSDLAVNLLPR